MLLADAEKVPRDLKNDNQSAVKDVVSFHKSVIKTLKRMQNKRGFLGSSTVSKDEFE